MVIVGGGNAALSAAHAARERAERVLVLVEKAPKEWSGGNSYFMAGTFRTTFNDLEDLTARLITIEPILGIHSVQRNRSHPRM